MFTKPFTEASTIVKCRNGNKDDRNGPEIPEIKKLRSEIKIKTFELVGGKLTYFLMWPKSSMSKCNIENI